MGQNISSDQDIPDSDHVLRYCSPRHVEKDTGEISAGAFGLRPKKEGREEEKYLSVNWVEYFEDMEINQQVAKIREDVSKNLELKPSGRFAKINVGRAKEEIESAEIKHILKEENPSHSGIYVTQENREATLELANMITSNDIFPAV